MNEFKRQIFASCAVLLDTYEEAKESFCFDIELFGEHPGIKEVLDRFDTHVPYLDFLMEVVEFRVFKVAPNRYACVTSEDYSASNGTFVPKIVISSKDIGDWESFKETFFKP